MSSTETCQPRWTIKAFHYPDLDSGTWIRILFRIVMHQNIIDWPFGLAHQGRLSLSTVGDKCAKDNLGEILLKFNKFLYTKM